MAKYQAGAFKSAIDRFAVKTATRAQIVHEAIAAQAFREIVFGGETTGAPGQPVESGDLRASWSNVPVAPLVNEIATDSPYAKSNEDGIARPGGGPYVLRSKQGGRHSVALVIAGFPRIVDKVLRELGSTGGGTAP